MNALVERPDEKYEIPTSIRDELRLAIKPEYQEALEKVAQLEDPIALERFTMHLVKQGLIRRWKWWHVRGIIMIEESDHLANALNEKRREIFLRNLRNCHTLERLYRTADKFLAGRMIELFDPTKNGEEKYQQLIPSVFNREEAELPIVFCEAFNKRREELLAL